MLAVEQLLVCCIALYYIALHCISDGSPRRTAVGRWHYLSISPGSSESAHSPLMGASCAVNRSQPHQRVKMPQARFLKVENRGF